jgi:anti-anti-sigma factor
MSNADGPVLACESRAEGVVIAVKGEIGLETVDRLDALLAQARPNEIVVIDLSACPYLDTTILGALVREFKLRGPHLRVVVPPDARIRRVFDVTQLGHVLRIVPDRSGAFD